MMSDSSSEHQHMYPRIRLLLVCKVYITWCCATDINLADMPVLLTHVHLSCNRLVLLLHLLLNKLCISLSLPHVLNDISISTSTWNIKSSTDWAQQVTFTTVLEEYWTVFHKIPFSLFLVWFLFVASFRTRPTHLHTHSHILATDNVKWRSERWLLSEETTSQSRLVRTCLTCFDSFGSFQL